MSQFFLFFSGVENVLLRIQKAPLSSNSCLILIFFCPGFLQGGGEEKKEKEEKREEWSRVY